MSERSESSLLNNPNNPATVPNHSMDSNILAFKALNKLQQNYKNKHKSPISLLGASTPSPSKIVKTKSLKLKNSKLHPSFQESNLNVRSSILHTAAARGIGIGIGPIDKTPKRDNNTNGGIGSSPISPENQFMNHPNFSKYDLKSYKNNRDNNNPHNTSNKHACKSLVRLQKSLKFNPSVMNAITPKHHSPWKKRHQTLHFTNPFQSPVHVTPEVKTPPKNTKNSNSLNKTNKARYSSTSQNNPDNGRDNPNNANNPDNGRQIYEYNKHKTAKGRNNIPKLDLSSLYTLNNDSANNANNPSNPGNPNNPSSSSFKSLHTSKSSPNMLNHYNSKKHSKHTKHNNKSHSSHPSIPRSHIHPSYHFKSPIPHADNNNNSNNKKNSPIPHAIHHGSVHHGYNENHDLDHYYYQYMLHNSPNHSKNRNMKYSDLNNSGSESSIHPSLEDYGPNLEDEIIGISASSHHHKHHKHHTSHSQDHDNTSNPRSHRDYLDIENERENDRLK